MATVTTPAPTIGRTEVPTDGREVRVIEPRQPGPLQRIREFWRYRRLVRYFGRQYIRHMWRSTWLGWLWVPMRPLLGVGARVIVFGGLLKAPSDGVPYLVFFLAGHAAWMMFSITLIRLTRCIEGARRYLRRIYIPRLVFVVASSSRGLLDLALYGILLAISLVYYGIARGHFYLHLGSHTPLTVAGLALLIALATSVGLWMSVLGAQARDPRLFMRRGIHFWYYMTPVIYPLSAVPGQWKNLASINPATAPMEMVREGLFGNGEIRSLGLASTAIALALIGGAGLWFFSRSEAASLDYL